MSQEEKEKSPRVVASTRDFFCEVVAEAVQRRQIRAPLSTQNYLVDLLERFLLTVNLFEETSEGGSSKSPMLAELYLRAVGAEGAEKVEILRRLGDSSLYISGFFGDSLHRKIVDLDYYVGIGGSAYETLASFTEDNGSAKIYLDLSSNFLGYVDVLTHISQKAMVQTDTDLLRLYSRYVATGSKLAEEQLIEKGVLTTTKTKQ